MARRREILVTGEIYHVFNKTIESKEVFSDKVAINLFLQLISYYKSTKSTLSFSKLKSIDNQIKEQILKKVKNKKYFKVEVLCFCLMPTHFHFLLRQKMDKGMEKFISDIINSFTKTFNLINERVGPIFLPRFKAVRIKKEEQSKHVLRYIHLNPYSSELVNNFEELLKYNCSSIRDYVEKSKIHGFVDREFFLRMFDRNRERLKKFMFDRADYQKILETIKYTKKFT